MNISKWLKVMALSLMAYGVSAYAEPVITSIDGAFIDGETLTVNGSGFTNKANAKPLFYWRADDGLEPSSLGRKSMWDGDFNGELVSRGDAGVVIADGSNKAVRMDFGKSSGAILAKVSFDSDKLYFWRKRYDDFDADYAYAIRTRLKDITALVAGKSLTDGVIMATADKSVKGRSINVDVSGTEATIYYERGFGNIDDVGLAKSRVNNGDRVYLYAVNDESLNTPLYEATINEGYGVFHTFNHKTMRFWGEYPIKQNTTYISLGDGVDAPLNLKAMMVSENTQVGTLWKDDWLNAIDHATKRWVREEYQYQAGDIDVANGQLHFWQDGVQAWKDKQFRFRTSSYPQKYTDLFQAQVSNGAQLGTYGYYDSLYIDDSWHRIIVCDSSTFSTCSRPEIQVPTLWSDSKVSFKFNAGSFSAFDELYVYVVDENGRVNSSGKLLCAKCPSRTELKVGK